MNVIKLLALQFLFLLLTANCSRQAKQPVDYVDPFIGTGYHGHTYPGATFPLGAVQLSPDTRKNHWDACAGYYYDDSAIAGFTHTHLSGTGCIDLGDILFQPNTRDLPATLSNYYLAPLTFSHRNETAAAGYYAVTFREEGIKAELTATTYAGLHRYTYGKGKTQSLIIDLRYVLDSGDAVDSLYIRKTAENELAGMRRTQGWTPNQYVFFVAKFSEPFQSAILADSIAALNFGISNGSPIVVKVGLSIVSEENARENLQHDIAGFDFDDIRRKAREAWNDALSDIAVESASEADLKNFYTARYHTKVVPNIISDVNGQYRRQNDEIRHLSRNEKRYSTFSIWDTYRAWNPLVTLTNHELVNNMINAFLDQYDVTGELPIWPLSSGETYCMIGYHSVSVITDAYLKGIRGFDVEKAFEAMKVSSNINRKSSDYYGKLGFIPSDMRSESVSCLLEYAYDDWCIAQMAQALGWEEDHREYLLRSLSYINVFDGYTKFFRGKRLDGNWDVFEPFVPGRAYTEATAWQYRFYVPHDMHGLVQLFGGKENFVEQLDSLFLVESIIEGEQNDITGLIGQYGHGNEPSHHMAYLYNYVGQPWKTQAMTRRILKEMYQPTPEGIIGNEDCGQMSAWYIFSSIGFYPVCPGSNEFLLTTPLFPRTILRLANGKNLEIRANQPEKNIYIDRVTLNGREITANYITYAQLMEGGTLNFVLSSRPNFERGVSDNDLPYSLTTGLQVSLPYIDRNVNQFVGEIDITLASATDGATIYYTLDGTEPDETAIRYDSPIRLTSSCNIKTKAYKEGYTPSSVFSIFATELVFEKPVAAIAQEQGVNYRYYEGAFQSVRDINETAFIEKGVLPFPSIKKAKQGDHFAFIFEGILAVPEDGVYEFMTRSDDGSVLYINGKQVLDNDGSHAATVATGRIALLKGYYPYQLLYFEDYEGEELEWAWKKPSAATFEAISETSLYLK
jgi:predicted alpha-1,2-mannosidase